MKKKTPQQYDAMVQKASPHSPVLKNCLFAFLSGGAICTLGQALANTFMLLGLDLKDARTRGRAFPSRSFSFPPR